MYLKRTPTIAWELTQMKHYASKSRRVIRRRWTFRIALVATVIGYGFVVWLG